MEQSRRFPTSRFSQYTCAINEGWRLGILSESLRPPRSNLVHLVSFGDASKKGLCAAVCAVVQQESGTMQQQGLVVAKSRLAKTNLTIPRLELVAGHMAVNLAVNDRRALEGFRVAEEIQCWLDSTVALHWLNDAGPYRQFVANRVGKVRAH